MKEKLIKKLNYFTGREYALWGLSAVFIVLAFIVFDRSNYLTLAAALIGATSLIFNAKGNPFGQLLIIIFSIIYMFISYSFAYYGEMITYMGMTAPMALLAFIAWLKNPYEGRRSEVTVNSIDKKEVLLMLVLSALVTIAFYFILDFFNTANMLFSTLSVTTSFAAVYLTFRRSPYYALAYAANDIVLIILWTMASLENISYVSVVACFATFLVNDIYGYICWGQMQKRQNN